MTTRAGDRSGGMSHPATPVQLTLWETLPPTEVPPHHDADREPASAAPSSGRAWAVPFDSDPYRCRWRGRRVRTIPGPDTWNPTNLEGAA